MAVDVRQSMQRAKILVADDDMNVRLLSRQCLESEGMEVIEAEDGNEALSAFVTQRPDLVFLDVEMPGMTGLEVCRRIRAMPQGENTPIMIVTGSDDRQSIDDGFDAGATQYKTKPVNWSLLSRDVHYMLRASDAFNSLKRQEDRLRYLAYFDPLTSLPNRRSFNEQLSRIIKRCDRMETYCALMFIDLDNFKRINDSIGHGRGDRLLVEISKRLINELRQDDAISYFTDETDENGEPEASGGAEIARLGGDEFTVVIGDVHSEDDVERIARRIMTTLSEPIPLQTHNPVVTPSIGIALYPRDGNDADSLVRNADTAMYAAKGGGRACYRFYNEEMNNRSVEKLKLEEDLRAALQGEQLELRYQPQIDAVSGKVVSLEALVRWKHPERGMISPADFIPVAEQSGQIIELGEWVMTEVARHCAYWESIELRDFRVSINISPLQFNQPDLVHYFRGFLERSGLSAERLELELTESAVMTDGESNISKLTKLRELGLQLAIDDFGTGYSSLSYLRRFPINTLKIDQSFIADMESADGAAIVDAIIGLAKTLNLRSIAEGIESDKQLAYLAAKGCDSMQGYFFARPLYAESVPEALAYDHRVDIRRACETHSST